MKNTLIWCIVSSVIMFSLVIMLEVAPQKNRIESLTKSLDSLKQIETEKQIINKTLRVAYPQLSEFEGKYYAEIFYDFCYVRYRVPFTIPAAIFGIESGWNPTLISKAKCRGLGQLGSSAAAEGCGRYGISYLEGYTEWNDILNVALSLDYFCKKFEAKGDSFAIRAYVGGDTWQKAVPGGDRDKYIKSYTKSIAEKEDIIKKVLVETTKLTYINNGVLYMIKK